MAKANFTVAPERADHPGTTPRQPAALFDGDNASSAARAGKTVAAAFVADQVDRVYADQMEQAHEEAAYRLDVHTRYELVLDSGDESAERAVLAEAAAFDKAHPSGQSLAGELLAKTLGLAA